MKASRYLSHVRRLRDLEQGIERYYRSIEPLVESAKLGPDVWQLPANFHRDDEALARALAALPAGRHCFEFNNDWEGFAVDNARSLSRRFRNE